MILAWLVSGQGDSRADYYLDDGEVLEHYPGLSKAFRGNSFSITVDDGCVPGHVGKKTRFVREGVENTFELDGLSVKTEYRGEKSKRMRVKQVVTITNTTDRDRTVEYRVRMKIEAERVLWDRKEYQITWVPRVFRAYRKQVSIPELARRQGKEDLEGLDGFRNYTHTVTAGSRISFGNGGARGIYDWSDALHLDPVVLVYQVGGSAIVELVVQGLEVPTGGKAVIDPIYGFDDPASYDLRFDGTDNIRGLALYQTLRIGDINGDNYSDLVLGCMSDSAYVIFGGPGILTGDRPLDVTANYNVRYTVPGYKALTGEGAIKIGDVNGDGRGDLILGAPIADYSSDKAGSVWVIFSTLVDDVGMGTGNVISLGDSANYNIRFDGAAQDDRLSSHYDLEVGDVNGDGVDDIVMGTPFADNNGEDSGSIWVVFSTLIDDVGVTTGNIRPLSVPGSYNIRLDGTVAGEMLGRQASLAIGDVNGDGLNDLSVGAYLADNNGADSGSIWLMFSTLVDDVGASTGNIWPLSVAGNYNIRFDGGSPGEVITSNDNVETGDLNGDGFGDLVLGSSSADYNGVDSGCAWVIFSTLVDDVGGTTGNVMPLSDPGSYNIRYDGAVAGDKMTSEKVDIAIGDVNGDGAGDLILGAPGAGNNGVMSGSVWIMFSTLIDDVGLTTGNDKPLSDGGNYNIRYDGGVSDYLGCRMSTGDVNGDGLSDLVIGTYLADYTGSSSGSVWIVFSTLVDNVGASTGNIKLLTDPGEYNIRFDGPLVGDRLPQVIAIGDLDGDGDDDLAVGTHDSDVNGSQSGGAWVIFSTLISSVGATTGNDMPLSNSGNYDIEFTGRMDFERLANEDVMLVGDVNGDNIDDLVMGTMYANYSGTNSGSVFVVFGGSGIGSGDKSLGISSNFNIRFDGDQPNAMLCRFGELTMGDVNGDGLGDLVLGESYPNGPTFGSGMVFVVFSTLIDDVGTTTGNVMPLSDPGSFNIRYDPGTNIAMLSYHRALAAGDVNGDGLGDLVLGTESTNLNGNSSGSAWVMFSTLVDDVGTTTGNIKELTVGANYNIRFDGAVAGDKLFERGAVAIGDVNADGLGDLVLGTGQAANNGANSGSAWVMFSTLIDDVGASTGNIMPLSAGTNYNIRYDGGGAGDNLTYDSNIRIGDVNGDGLGDLVLGGEGGDNNGLDSGSIWVMFSTLIDDVGASTGNVASLSEPANYNIRYDGSAADERLSYSAAVEIGDVSGDGVEDLLLGSKYADLGGVDAGSVWVMFSTLIDDVGISTGNTRPLSNPSSYNIRYDGQAGDYLGSGGTIVTGDLSGDGTNDLILGASGADNNGSTSGSVWVMFSTLIDDMGTTNGNVISLSPATSYSNRFDGSGKSTGLSAYGVLDVGDVNDDGIDDLIAGAPLAHDASYFSGSVWVVFGGCTTNVDCPLCYQCIANACIYQAPGSDLKNDCTADDCNTGNCDGNGFCGLIGAGTPCTDATTDDCLDARCDGSGTCDQAFAIKMPGEACEDGLFCTVPDTCDGSGSCIPGVGDPCTGGGECNQVCSEVDDNCFDPLDTSCGSDWDTECDNPDTCDGAGFCQPNNEPDGTGCDDGLYCSNPDLCSAGSCAGPQRTCDDSEPCTQDSCNETADRCDNQSMVNGAPCDDGLYCTEGEACQSGVCTGTQVDCSGLDDMCNTGFCNEATDRCEADPVPKNGVRCDDDVVCTENDICRDGRCAGTEMDCSGSDGECVEGGCVDGQCEALSSGERNDCSGCYRCSTGEAGIVCDWGRDISAAPCEEGLCKLEQVFCDASDNCIIEGYCDEEVEGCGIPVVYGKGPGETLNCRLPEGKVGVRVEMVTSSGGVGSFLPVRVNLTNTPINGWNKCIYDLRLALEFNPEGDGRPGGHIGYVLRSALLQGGEVSVEEVVDAQNQRVVLTLGGEDDCLPAPGDGGLWVLDFLLVRGSFEDGWFKVNVWAPCDSPNQVMGCHTDAGSVDQHRVSGTWYSYTSGKSFEEEEEIGKILQSPVLGCQCHAFYGPGSSLGGMEGRCGRFWILVILVLAVFRTRANYLKRAKRDVTHRFEA